MIKQILFFALPSDLNELFQSLESKVDVKYCLSGNSTETRNHNEVLEYCSAHEISSLGKATGDQNATCESFLVINKSAQVKVRKLVGSSGETRQLVDQYENENSVLMCVGGEHYTSAIISGRFSTIHDTVFSQHFMKLVQSELKKKFKKIRAFYVGKAALMSLESGGRLVCASISSPPEFDLKMTSPQ